MAITDELREFASHCAGGMGGDALRDIADRIDAEHEADVSTACRLAAGLDNDVLSKRGYIALPVDADGVPIHVEDRLDGYNRTITVQEIIWCGMCRWTMMDEYGNEWHDCAAFSHHHAPTVEDVLREFADEVQRCCDTEDTIAEYAARLRLAEEDK